jgi:predicted SAM-dependent methyltransferase
VEHSSTLSALVRRVPFYGRRLHREYVVGRVRREMRAARELNVVIGSGDKAFDNWFTTDVDILDITRPADWSALFEPNSIDRLLAEHVFEHLSEDECRAAFAECQRYLKPGGLLRIAVPDGYRRDPEYVAEVTPPKDGHKSLFTIDTLPALLEGAGFRVEPLEYFDRDERFHARPWDEREGFITRSKPFDTQERFKRGELFYTSLIVDARKESTEI